MSGHSKWASIKHKKAATDAKRGKIFTKLVKEISVAAREGGGSVELNPRLRQAVLSAKSQNMPGDNIDRAIKKGTGELPGVIYSELTYEGYAAGGVAVYVEIMTDNKNRTAAEVRKIFSKRGGALGETGCVGWMFHRKGFIAITKDKIDEDSLMNIVLDAGAEDLKADGEIFEVYSALDNFEQVKKALQDKNIEWKECEVAMIPSITVPVTDSNVAKQVLALMEELEDHDDVQKVFANFDIDERLME